MTPLYVLNPNSRMEELQVADHKDGGWVYTEHDPESPEWIPGL
jgi:hypothetical protein